MCYLIITKAESSRVFVVKGYVKEVAVKMLGFTMDDVKTYCLADFEIDCLDISKQVILEL